MLTRKLTLTALAALTGLSLTACGGDGGNDDRAGSEGTQGPVTSTAPTEGTAEPSPAAPTTTDSASAPAGGKSSEGEGSATKGACRTGDLKISATDATIGDRDPGTVAVTFQNAGSAPCTLNPYAGVDLKTNAGTISAERTHKPADPRAQSILKPGQKIYFAVWYPLNKSGGSGVRITGLVVTPPDETKSVTLTWPGEASLPVTEDDGGRGVEVGPMGSAGQGEG